MEKLAKKTHTKFDQIQGRVYARCLNVIFPSLFFLVDG